MSEKDKALSITADDLKDLLSSAVKAAVEEAKKPYVSEADLRKLEQDQQDRKQQAELSLAVIEGKKNSQRICAHHTRGRYHAVFVHDDLGGYILCQKCQAVIRPGQVPAQYKGTVIFNTELFNRLFQETSDSGVFA